MPIKKVDVLLVGSGIMSATLATLLTELDGTLQLLMVERLAHVAAESSDAWNNAGTGHAGYCELNYTPMDDDGTIDIGRALAINAAFEVSLQFWSYLVENNTLPNPTNFINRTPHLSFVWGEADVAYLRKRYDLLKTHPLFQSMEYTEEVALLNKWLPLVMEQRKEKVKVAATRVAFGSDIDFGLITRKLVDELEFKSEATSPQFELNLNTEVQGLKQLKNGRWHVTVTNGLSKKLHTIETGFVFLGAGGGALKLLQKSGTPESHGYGGFPVSGQWLICTNPEVINRHESKVYGKAALGAPPMSVPHLDRRIIDGKPALLFGPFAGFTTKFLNKGSYLDLIKSLKLNNLKSMLSVGWHHMDLTRYLMREALQTHTSRMNALREYYPEAVDSDWHLENAGKRVQIIKNCDKKGGKLEFGTEIVTAEDCSIAALLGASPGASVAVQTMITVIERCFCAKMYSYDWQEKMKKLVPSYGQSLIEDETLLRTIRERTLKTLNLL